MSKNNNFNQNRNSGGSTGFNGLPPQDLDAEKSVIGALLIDKDAIIKVVEFLRPKHFYKTSHQIIYEAILDLYEKREPADLITVPGALKKKHDLEEIGGVSYLSELANFVPTAANVEFYGHLIKDTAIKRAVLTGAAEISELVYNEPNTDELLDRSEQILYSISQDRMHRDFVHAKDILEITFERLDELSRTRGALRGTPSGLKSVDKMLSGLQKENLVILAARPSVGKSSFAVNIAQHAAIFRFVT
jgi:replicative DNA helicase